MKKTKLLLGLLLMLIIFLGVSVAFLRTSNQNSGLKKADDTQSSSNSPITPSSLLTPTPEMEKEKTGGGEENGSSPQGEETKTNPYSSQTNRVLPPPTSSVWQPSEVSPQKTMEEFLKAVSEGDPANYPYFLNFEARNNQSLYLVPANWNGQRDTFLVTDEMRADGETYKITMTYYKGQIEEANPLGKIGYFLVYSFNKWLIFDTTKE
jgi:hypothetical protein